MKRYQLLLLEKFFASLRFPNLKNVYIIGAQHIVSSTINLCEVFLAAGLPPGNLSLIGKCYSTNPEVLQYLQSLDIDVSKKSLAFNSKVSFDKQYRSNIKAFISSRKKKLLSKGIEKIIILDDGGVLINEIEEFFLLSSHQPSTQLIGVEQTSAGYRLLKDKGAKIPIINCARSKIKLIKESPVIAEVVLEQTLFHLKTLNISPKSCLIIGKGSVGTSLFRKFKAHFDTEIYDQKHRISTITNLQKELIHFDLIVGATGNSSLNILEAECKENACFVSASSSDREFNALPLRKKCKATQNCHQHLFHKSRYLLNCGFPINFDENYNQIDGEQFQLTRAILLAGVFQASTCIKPPKRIISLDKKLQDEIFSLLQEQEIQLRAKEAIPQYA